MALAANSIAHPVWAQPNSVLASSPQDSVGGTVIANVTVEDGPFSLGYDAENGYVYVANAGSDTVSVVSGTTVMATVQVGHGPYGLGFDSGNGYVYVANAGSNTVSVINWTTVVTTVLVGGPPVGFYPTGVTYDSGNGYVYVTNGFSNAVIVINGTTVVATVPVGLRPSAVDYDSGNGYVYVANYFSNTVSVISGLTVLATLPVAARGEQPYGVAYDSGNGYVYVPNAGSVTVINGTTIVSSVEVGGYSEGVGYDSGNGYVYVTNNEDFVSVISGTNVVATIPVGFSPFGVVYDSGNGYVYVANAGSDSVSVISTTADFRISPSPTSLTVVGESSLCEGRSIVCEDEASTSIGVSGVNGFMGNVRLTASVSPGDGSLIVYCRPPSILVKPGETSNAKCTVEPEISPASPATYVVTIRVTNGSLSHSITIPVVVTPATTR